MPGENFYEIGTADDFVRWAFQMYRAGADAVYCSASYATVKAMADENIPVIGHVGLIPSRKTWTGGFKAVGKTAAAALEILDAVRKYEAAGAFGAEIEVVPVEVATEISRRTSLFLLSMGAGAGCDAQYLFAEDVLGPIAATCHGTVKSIATSPLNMTGCKTSASPLSRNMSPTSRAAPIPRPAMSCTWCPRNWKSSGAKFHAAAGPERFLWPFFCAQFPDAQGQRHRDGERPRQRFETGKALFNYLT